MTHKTVNITLSGHHYHTYMHNDVKSSLQHKYQSMSHRAWDIAVRSNTCSYSCETHKTIRAGIVGAHLNGSVKNCGASRVVFPQYGSFLGSVLA